MSDSASALITVTRFELLAKPSLTVAPPAKQIALIRAVKPPAHFYRYLLSLIPDSEIACRRRGASDDAIAGFIDHDDVALYVLHMDGVPAGLGEIDFRKLPEARLTSAAVGKDFSNPHLQRYLLAQLIALAWSRETESVVAEVTTRDAKGTLSLYQACGFVVYEQLTLDADEEPAE